MGESTIWTLGPALTIASFMVVLLFVIVRIRSLNASTLNSESQSSNCIQSRPLCCSTLQSTKPPASRGVPRAPYTPHAPHALALYSTFAPNTQRLAARRPNVICKAGGVLGGTGGDPEARFSDFGDSTSRAAPGIPAEVSRSRAKRIVKRAGPVKVVRRGTKEEEGLYCVLELN